MKDSETILTELQEAVDAVKDKMRSESSKFPDHGYAWGPWLKWHGENNLGPDTDGFLVNVYRRSPLAKCWLVSEAHKIDWKHENSPEDVLYYRVQVVPEEEA